MVVRRLMRTHGTLTRWNDERGFGFIAPAHAGDEIFVHISAFPRDGTRPQAGELVSFDVETGKDGKKRAVRVLRPGARSAPRRRESAAHGHPFLFTALGLLAAAAAGSYAYREFAPGRPLYKSADLPAGDSISARAAADERFRCDGRTRCTQMTSCAEARYFLQNCPGVKMDGDGDGEPCEDQWCR